MRIRLYALQKWNVIAINLLKKKKKQHKEKMVDPTARANKSA
jgi:hypothetical protein